MPTTWMVCRPRQRTETCVPHNEGTDVYVYGMATVCPWWIDMLPATTGTRKGDQIRVGQSATAQTLICGCDRTESD